MNSIGARLVARPVSSRVNNARNDDSGLIDEIQSAPEQKVIAERKLRTPALIARPSN